MPTLIWQVGNSFSRHLLNLCSYRKNARWRFIGVDTGPYRDNTLRPFARRLASTLRPFLVDILLRKPWTLLRWRFFG